MENYDTSIAPSDAIVKVGDTFTQTFSVWAEEPTDKVLLRFGFWGLNLQPEYDAEIVGWKVDAPSAKSCNYDSQSGLLECYARYLQTGQMATFTTVFHALQEGQVRTDASLQTQTANGLKFTGESQMWFIENEPIEFNLNPQIQWGGGTYQTIDVMLAGLYDRTLTDFSFELTYPRYLASYLGHFEDNSLTNGWAIDANEVLDPETGMMKLTVAGTAQGRPISAYGNGGQLGKLIQITFKNFSYPGQTFDFHLVHPVVNGAAFAVKGSTGTVTIQPYRVYGKILSYADDVPFPGISVMLTNTVPTTYTTITTETGGYELFSTQPGTHVLSWNLDTNIRHQEVSHSDVSTILRCVVGKQTCPTNADVDYSRTVEAHDAYLVVEELLGHHHNESYVFQLRCDYSQLQMGLTLSMSQEIGTFRCGIIGDADNSVLVQEANVASMPSAMFGTQSANGQFVNVQFVINEVGLDGATIDLQMTNAKLVGATGEGNWQVANNGTRVIVAGSELADTITVNLVFEVQGEGTVNVQSLRTLGKAVYSDVSSITLKPGQMPILLEPFAYLPMLFGN